MATKIACNPGNFTYGRQGCKVTHIVVHYTASMASARNNCLYFANNSSCNASAHYFIDGTGVYKSVRERDTAWHCGNWSGNLHSIGIEVVSDGRNFSTAEKKHLRSLVRKLMKRYGVPASRVIRHYDTVDRFGGSTLDPHKRCPAPYIDSAKWKSLHAYITKAGKAKKKHGTYTVKKGDTLAKIGKRLDVSWKTLKWKNHIKDVTKLRPGQKLKY